MHAMGFAVDYLRSARMDQDLAQVLCTSSTQKLEVARQVVTCAFLRWQQWFENPSIDQNAVGLRPTTLADFQFFHDHVMSVLRENDVRYISSTHFDRILFDLIQKQLLPGSNRAERLVKLFTMGATEYHGFNAVYTESIKKHGLNPKAKFHKCENINQVYQIWNQTKREADYVRRDQNVLSLTPEPDVAYHHAKYSPEWFCLFNQEIRLDHLLDTLTSDCLSPQETEQVLQFFDYWWDKLATPENPKIAYVPMFRDPNVLQRRINFNLHYLQHFGRKEGLKKLLQSSMYAGYEQLHPEPILPEEIQMVDVKTDQAFSQKLSHIKDCFHANLQAKLSLKQQYDVIQNMNFQLV